MPVIPALVDHVDSTINLEEVLGLIQQKLSCNIIAVSCLTHSQLNKWSSAKFLVCFNFQSASMWLKISENVQVSNRLDLGETPSYLASHLDPSCL